MNQSVLKAVPRAQTTKGELNKLRAQGQIPAVIYGGGEAATHVLLDEKEFLKIAAGASESTILGIDLAGTKKRAFVKARQRDCLTNRIIHVDLLEVISGRLLHARVPLHLVGVPVGVREGRRSREPGPRDRGRVRSRPPARAHRGRCFRASRQPLHPRP